MIERKKILRVKPRRIARLFKRKSRVKVYIIKIRASKLKNDKTKSTIVYES